MILVRSEYIHILADSPLFWWSRTGVYKQAYAPNDVIKHIRHIIYVHEPPVQLRIGEDMMMLIMIK